MKKALITGITGQVGSYLAELLLKKGYEVHGIVRRVAAEDPQQRLWRIKHILNRLTLHSASLDNYASIYSVIEQIKPDECYHLAAQSFVSYSFEDEFSTLTTNIHGTHFLLSVIKQRAPNCKLFFAASSEMFGKVQKMPQNEKTPFHPRSSYGISKVAGFDLVRYYREAHGMHASSGIMFNNECVSENTPVIIRKEGLIFIKRMNDIKKPANKGKNIQQWKIKDVEIWDGDKFTSLNFLTATKRKKEDADFLCKIFNTRNGIVEVTDYHNMLDETQEKIQAKNIKNGSKLCHKKFPLQIPSSCKLSKEEARFLGMMVADGWVDKTGRANFANNDKKLMIKFEELWKNIALGTLFIKTYGTEYGESTRATLNGGANYLKYLRNQLYTFDSFKKVPDRILNADKKTQLFFLEGYNECDGLKSNRCTYTFKNFTTSSILLAQGLLYLIKQNTNQEFSITFMSDIEHYGYYFINFLSPTDRSLKEKKVKDLLKRGMSQRKINKETGISIGLIRKIQKGGHAQICHHLSKPKNTVKKIIAHKTQPNWVFDLETGSGKFMAGVGTIVVSNSPRRGMEFVTRKITNAAARIKLGLDNELRLGNLDAERDWGSTGDYVKAMQLMLQQDGPDDYVIATNKTHSVKEFVDLAFGYFGLDWTHYVIVDKNLFRPTEVQILKGDYSKIKKVLGWNPTIKFEGLVQRMVRADFTRLRKNMP